MERAERVLVEDCAEIDIPNLYKYAHRQEWRSYTDSDGKTSEVKVVSTASESANEVVEAKCVFVANAPVLALAITIIDSHGKKREHTEVLELDSTDCFLGGERLWARCPACDERIAKLYKPPGESCFGCRRCHSISYKSSRESGNPTKVLERQIARLCRKLGGTSADAWRYAPVPEKKRGMHMETYAKLALELWSLKIRYDDKLIKGSPVSEENKRCRIAYFLQNVPVSAVLLWEFWDSPSI